MNRTQATWEKVIWARQLGQNYRDRTTRGKGNRSARRAIRTERGMEHLRDAGEEIYTDRPEVLERGAQLINAAKLAGRY